MNGPHIREDRQHRVIYTSPDVIVGGASTTSKSGVLLVLVPDGALASTTSTSGVLLLLSQDSPLACLLFVFCVSTSRL